MVHVVCHHDGAKRGNENVVVLIFEIQQHINLQYEKNILSQFFFNVEKKVLFFFLIGKEKKF